jgi:hypothetical protein
MSALPPIETAKADFPKNKNHVCFTLKADMCRANTDMPPLGWKEITIEYNRTCRRYALRLRLRSSSQA